MKMYRYGLLQHPRTWGQMVLWCKQNLGEAQPWGGVVLEPQSVKKPHKWAMGKRRMLPSSDSAEWPCFWIPEGPVHTAFLLRFA